MKSFRSLFYTRVSKAIMAIVLFVLSCFIGEYYVKYFDLYNQDSESFNNAVRQIDSYDYETSFYFRKMVETTTENVITLTMNYPDVFEKKLSGDELLQYYASIGDLTFPKIYESFASIEGLSFAVVNYENKKIYSSIPQLNGQSIEVNARKYFGKSGKMLLVARSCQAPYFETDAFIDYAEHIRRCASKYDENFDLYISFGDDATFEENAEKYSALHFSMREKIEKLNNIVLTLVAFAAFASFCIITVTGRQEPEGKIYLSPINKLPNDLVIVVYILVLVCIASLFRTSFFMIVTHKAEYDVFWFTKSEAFYIERIKFCIVSFICFFVNLICILKRSYKTGTLIKNTYLYPVIKRLTDRVKSLIKTAEKSDSEQ